MWSKLIFLPRFQQLPDLGLLRFQLGNVVLIAAPGAVDAAEDEENKQKVFAINENGTANLAKACRDIDCKMLYISTDYVFDGQGNTPWQSDCKDYAQIALIKPY